MLSRTQTDDLFEPYGIKLTDSMYERLSVYAHMLTERNKVMNLTAITDDMGIAEKHFFDSIYPFTLFVPDKGSRLIDVGTGAGFPAGPLKIFRDDLDITLLDSLNKRVGFLKEVSDAAGLGAKCIHGRAEDLGKDIAYRESFDIATARAVSNLTALSEYCLPLVRIGGYFVSLKGSAGGEELRAAEKSIKVLGGSVEKTLRYTLPSGDGRTLIIIKKTAPTPAVYPRNAGQIKRSAPV
ncbi:MAG: 16S rRNA (guanine(527)-N(7))-methyltransferase RsmG [Ruminococcus sp.]|nr:16S rRNA (guanine(527)-N(7))-methyltransferase RsmG [Ruminococcus sp.]